MENKTQTKITTVSSAAKKLLSILLAIIMLCSITVGIDLSAYAATAHTQQEAVNWMSSKIGVKVGDGQCPALIRAYYEYLGATCPGGNGKDYAWNALPSGWTRIQYYNGFSAKPGDIAVWTSTSSTLGAKYGHVGLVLSATSTNMTIVDQGASYGYKVHSGSWKYSSGFYGVIRPDFKSASRGELTVPTIQIDSNVYYVGNNIHISWDKTSANTDFYQYWLIIKNTTNGKQYYAGSPGAAGNVNANSYNFTVTEAGNYLITVYAVPYNNKNSRQKVATKSFTANKNEITFPTISLNKTTYSVGDTMHISWTATSSNTDFYQYWLIVKNITNGKKYYEGATAGAGITTVNYYDFIIPTAGNYKITVYAVPYYNKGTRQKYDVKEISIHTYNNAVITKEATCTANGVKTYTCTTCGATKTETIKATGHTYDKGKVTKAATCTATGIKTYTCTKCKATKKETIKATGHSYKTTVTKATTKKNGSSVTKCTKCGNVSKKSTIYYPKTVTLSTTAYTYDGKVKKPGVTVKNSAGKTIAASNYTVTYPSGRKNVGTYTVKITFKGNYSGSVSKTFKINPKNTSISGLTAQSKAFTVKLKKYTTQTTGYQIQYSTSSNFSNAKTVTVKNSTTSKKISKLTGKKKYYVRVRTYKTVGKTNYYSGWTKAKTVTTKK